MWTNCEGKEAGQSCPRHSPALAHAPRDGAKEQLLLKTTVWVWGPELGETRRPGQGQARASRHAPSRRRARDNGRNERGAPRAAGSRAGSCQHRELSSPLPKGREPGAELAGETVRYFYFSCTLRAASSCWFALCLTASSHLCGAGAAGPHPAAVVMLSSSNVSFLPVWLEQTFPPPPRLYSQRPDKEGSSPPSVCRQGQRPTEPLSHPQLLYAAQNGVVTSLVTLAPKSQPAPRGLMAHVSTSSGSDQTRSQKAPLWGIS